MFGSEAAVVRILVAALCGAAIGVERQWSGHASGPEARLGGVRTFTLLGALAGIAGWLWSAGHHPIGAVFAAGAVALVVAGYVAASRSDVEGTTEVAALIVLAAGVLAGIGYLALASGIVAVTGLLLVEKTQLHRAITRFDDAEVRAGMRFAVMAAVILPLLPAGPYGPWGGFRPRELWLLVLFFSGLSFVGFIARHAVGARQGYALAGLLGGVVSSTNVTVTFARASRAHTEIARPLACGVLAANTVLFVRILVAVLVLNAPLAAALLPYLAAPMVAGILMTVSSWKRLPPEEPRVAGPSNPLELRSALVMAILFQVVLFGVHVMRENFGDVGLVVSGAILGLTDTDALTISMAKTAGASALDVPARAIAAGIVSNTLFKLAAALLLGRGALRLVVAVGLGIIAAAGVGSILFL